MRNLFFDFFLFAASSMRIFKIHVSTVGQCEFCTRCVCVSGFILLFCLFASFSALESSLILFSSVSCVAVVGLFFLYFYSVVAHSIQTHEM